VNLVGNDRNIIKEYNDRVIIENEISIYNTYHFRKAYNSKALKDKIYSKLLINNIRNKILDKILKQKKCKKKDVYNFIKLLKIPGGYYYYSEIDKIIKLNRKLLLKKLSAEVYYQYF